MSINLRDLVIGEQNDFISHDQFRGIWNRAFQDNTSTLWGKETRKVEYRKNKKILLYSDLKAVINKMNDHPQNAEACRADFEEFIKTMDILEIPEAPSPYIWYNSTRDGINLRPGKTLTSGKLPPAIVMAGQTSHAIVGGRTGSGKSVFLNNLILNMMLEYAPWELELYLADFKKVEMSQYMNKYPAPHVRACAATSEIDYVLTLIKYIKERKDDRETLFSRLQIVDIEGFREEFGTKRIARNLPEIVMPRILFLVDEFQQLFLDATSKQKDQIDDLITDITRKGRAPGVHLLFASQDMSGALSEKQMSNFRMRFALSCEGAVSSQILGNNGAVSLKRGQVICNTKSKELEDNQLFQVPNVKAKTEYSSGDETTDSYLYSVLREVMGYAKKMNYCYRENQKYYNEDQQWDIKELEKILAVPTLIEARGNISNAYFASILFGKSVVHTNKRYDIVNFHLERGKNRNVLCVSGNNEDIAYMMKLFAVNFGSLNNSHEIKHRFADLNPVVSMMYDRQMFERDLRISETLRNQQIQYCTSADEFQDHFQKQYESRRAIVGMLQNSEQCKNSFDFFRMILEKFFIPGVSRESIEEEILAMGLTRDGSNYMQYLEDDDPDISMFFNLWHKFKIEKIPSNLLFPPMICWFNGIENIERIPQWFESFAANCMDVNILCIFFSASAVPYSIGTTCTYNFVSGTDSSLYDKYYDERIHVGAENIKTFCFIKNRNRKVAFKKYKVEFNEIENNTFELDEIIPISFL